MDMRVSGGPMKDLALVVVVVALNGGPMRGMGVLVVR